MNSTGRTLAVYNKMADDYAAMTAHDSAFPTLERFIAALPAGGRVLDLGCGPGHAAAKMDARGLRVDATDTSGEMVRLAARHQGLCVCQQGFDDLDAHNRYDGIWASFSLLHAAKTALPRHLAAVHRAMRPRGILHLGMKLGDGEGPDRLGRHYAYYSAPALKQHLHNAGFSPIGSVEGKDKGMAGSIDPWMVVIAHA